MGLAQLLDWILPHQKKAGHKRPNGKGRSGPSQKASAPLRMVSVADRDLPPSSPDVVADEVDANAQLFKDPQRLPLIKRVLSACPEKPYDKLLVVEGHRRQAAIVETEDGIFMLSDSSFFTTAKYATLKERLSSIPGIGPIKYVNNVDSGVLLTIYKMVEGKPSLESEFRLDAKQEPEALAHIRTIFSEALREDASDIHIMARHPFGKICFRIDGKIRAWKSYPFDTLKLVSGYAFMKMAEDGSRSDGNFNERSIQKCMIPFVSEGAKIKLRYNSVPCLGGFDVVLRILHTEVSAEKVPMPVELGYAPYHEKQLELATRTPIGGIGIAGVTGSGKSTTLKTLMQMPKDRKLKKYYSVEEPVEYRMYGVTQVQGGDSFVPVMKGFVRMDPDVIMVGEVNDRDTGSLLKYMIQTGHQVMFSLHASSAIDLFGRLASEEIGIPLNVLTSKSFMSAVIYQALITRLCPHCKLPAKDHMSEERLDLLSGKYGLPLDLISVANPEGCEKCSHRGEKGQIVAAEILMPTTEMLIALRKGDDLEAERIWRSTRTHPFHEDNMKGKTAFEHGLYHVSKGIVDPRAVEVFSPLETYEIISI